MDETKPKNRKNEARKIGKWLVYDIDTRLYAYEEAGLDIYRAGRDRIDTEATGKQAGEDREGTEMRHGRAAAWGSRGQAPHTDGQTQTGTGRREGEGAEEEETGRK